MIKLSRIIVMTLFLVVASLFIAQETNAAYVTVNGTFQNFTYDTKGKENGIAITLKGGMTRSYSFTIPHVFINGQLSKFKEMHRGMAVKLRIEKNKVTKINATTPVSEAGSIPKNSEVLYGVITKIDPKGAFVTLAPDTGFETAYYVNSSTKYVKDNKYVTKSSLYEGDRVRLSFSTMDGAFITEVKIIEGATAIKNLYKGELNLVNSILNRISVGNTHPFTNWSFGSKYDYTLKSFTFDENTKIFAYGSFIRPSELKQYAGHEVYFVTTTVNGKEIINKIVVLENNERTFNERITAVNTASKFIKLEKTGQLNYHAGTILIKDGRLVNPTVMETGGTAFVVTDGTTKSKYAHVVNIVGTASTNPTLSKQSILFGKLHFVDGTAYQLTYTDAVKMENNVWKAVANQTVAFSNNTNAILNYNSNVIEIDSKTELENYQSYYGYFLVESGVVKGIHLLDYSQPKSTKAIKGSIQSLRKVSPITFSLDNVSTWSAGKWIASGAVKDLNLDQAMIIKDGAIIPPSKMKVSDQVTVYSSDTLRVDIVIVE